MRRRLLSPRAGLRIVVVNRLDPKHGAVFNSRPKSRAASLRRAILQRKVRNTLCQSEGNQDRLRSQPQKLSLLQNKPRVPRLNRTQSMGLNAQAAMKKPPRGVVNVNPEKHVAGQENRPESRRRAASLRRATRHRPQHNLRRT